MCLRGEGRGKLLGVYVLGEVKLLSGLLEKELEKSLCEPLVFNSFSLLNIFSNLRFFT